MLSSRVWSHSVRELKYEQDLGGVGDSEVLFLHGSGMSVTILHVKLGGGRGTTGSARERAGGLLAVFSCTFVALAVAHSMAAGVGTAGDEPPLVP